MVVDCGAEVLAGWVGAGVEYKQQPTLNIFLFPKLCKLTSAISKKDYGSIKSLNLKAEEIAEVELKEQAELNRRAKKYRGTNPQPTFILPLTKHSMMILIFQDV